MIFSSPMFLFYFLPISLTVYFLLPKIEWRNHWLLLVSLIFYAWGEPVFVLALLISTTLNYYIGFYLDEEKYLSRKSWLIIGCIWNLGLLGVVKYADFLIVNINQILQYVDISLPLPSIALPIGVSFFTFQILSYIIDLYNKNIKLEQSWERLTLYVVMFPQLIAGPIVRYRNVAHQLQHRHTTANRLISGTRVFIVGLAQKILIANEVGRVADIVFSIHDLSIVEAWIGLVCYSLQIYFDFMGYSNMAIGLGFVLGFSFPRNFRLPYSAHSITEFWRRWHISLSTWLRDYLYIPLGGNRVTKLGVYRNLFLVFFLCGLWHGASWNFVIWGMIHGVFLVLERAFLGELLAKLPRYLAHGYTLLIAMLAWVWFRTNDVNQAIAYLKHLFDVPTLLAPLDIQLHIALTPLWAITVVVGVILSIRRWPQIKLLKNELIMDLIYFALLCLSLMQVADQSYNPFLYFRF